MKKEEEYITIKKSHYNKLIAEIKELRDMLVEFMDKSAEEYEALVKENKALKADLNAFKNNTSSRKNSSNSDLPPSKDLFRIDRRKSLREKSDKPSGGQPGHTGSTIEFNQNPDRTIDLFPRQHCEACNAWLNPELAQLADQRQVIDIPPIHTITTQFNAFKITCSCGCINKAHFPDQVNAPVQYGPRFRSWINYFSFRQFIPFKRMTELFEDCFNLHISQGTIFNTIKRSASKAKATYDSIKTMVQKAEAVGTDETPIFTNGVKNTLWTWQTSLLTFLAVTSSRHAFHIDKLFPNGFKNAILSSDQYQAHLNTPAKGHQICWVHILRKIAGLLQQHDHYWLKQLKAFYKRAANLKKLKPKYHRNSNDAKSIEHQLNKLLLRKLRKNTPTDIVRLQQSLKKCKPFLLTFLFHEKVPPDNNHSEKAIRNAKVITKISGGFKSLQHEYAVFRSIIDSAIKHKLNILNTISDIENGEFIIFRPE